jgi:hypothetical protein
LKSNRSDTIERESETVKKERSKEKMTAAYNNLAVWRNGGSNPAENAVRN